MGTAHPGQHPPGSRHYAARQAADDEDRQTQPVEHVTLTNAPEQRRPASVATGADREPRAGTRALPITARRRSIADHLARAFREPLARVIGDRRW